MFFYNVKQNQLSSFNHILDPDYFTNIPSSEELMYPYFKNLIIPSSIQHITGIYIHISIHNQDEKIKQHHYEKVCLQLQHYIEKYFDYCGANLFNSCYNYLFITMFNANIRDLIESARLLESDIKRKSHSKIILKFGIYYSNKFVNPYDLYNGAIDQYYNTLKNNKLLSSNAYSYLEDKNENKVWELCGK